MDEMYSNSATVSSHLPEVLAQGRGVIGQQCVNQAKQLHDSLILPEVLVALQQEHELMAVAACRGRHKHHL